MCPRICFDYKTIWNISGLPSQQWHTQVGLRGLAPTYTARIFFPHSYNFLMLLGTPFQYNEVGAATVMVAHLNCLNFELHWLCKLWSFNNFQIVANITQSLVIVFFPEVDYSLQLLELSAFWRTSTLCKFSRNENPHILSP